MRRASVPVLLAWGVICLATLLWAVFDMEARLPHEAKVTLPPATTLAIGTPMGPTPTFHTTLTLQNLTEAPTQVFVAFGADSVIRADDWVFCAASSPLTCSFTLEANGEREAPSASYLNATLSFGSPVSCGVTKAELNLNNPNWYDVVDVSLVDGFSNKIQIVANGTTLGPPKGQEGNERVFGVYPYGCDVCTAREHPPCGISSGSAGCKAGSQYKPEVPCQYQGPLRGGGGTVVVTLVP